MITAIIFIIVLSVIVFVHELGHFIMAKRAGIKVEEFGFGFPPRIWGFKPKGSETTYSINWIPFGGFVKPKGEDDSDIRDADSFNAKGFWPRAGVIVAGVVMNVILAVVLLALGNMIGSRIPVTDTTSAKDVKIQITQIAKGSPADQAGLKVFDEIIGFPTVEATQKYISDHRGQDITLNLARGPVHVTPRVNPPPGEGALGIALAKTGFVRYAWYAALWQGLKDTLNTLWLIISGFAHIIKNLTTTGKAGVELAGPVGIAVVTGQAARMGFTYLLQFMAFISLNLAVINLVPFPALDGGRLLFLIIEKIKGSPLPKRIESGFNTVGFVLLITLMLYVTFKDVVKFF